MEDRTPGNRTPAGVRGNPAEQARWKAAAKAAGFEEFAVWAREVLDRAASGGRGAEPSDPEYDEAVAFLAQRYPVKDRSELVRMAVLKAAERERLDPGSAFRVDAVAAGITRTGDAGPPKRTRGGR